MQTQAEKIYDLYSKDPLIFGNMYFPHHFRDESPTFHLKLISEYMKNRFLAVAAPRGSAKSTILCFLNPIHNITFKKKHFIIIVQNTYAKAVSSLETIKSEFRENQDLKRDFGVEISKDREGDSIFTHPDGFKTRVLCKGAEQLGSIRGEKFGAYRPDLILVDDLEADEQCANREIRDALLERYKDALEPAIDPHTGCIHVVGTILHEDSVMKKLVTPGIFKQYRKLLYKARYIGKVSGKTLSLWEDRWTVEQLNEMEREEPSKFAKEYQNDPVSGMMSNFSREDFRYWYIENGDYVLMDAESNIISRGALSSCKGAIACDLAWDAKKKDDHSVLMPAYFTPNSDILIDEYIAEKGMKPDKFISYLFPMKDKVENRCKGKCTIGFEKGKLEKVMKWFLKKEERLRNDFLIKKDLLWDADKITRIVTRLQSRYKNHVIYHRKGMGDLEHQLLQVPSGKHDDLPDAVQGLVQLFQVAPNRKEEVKVIEEDEGIAWLMKNAIPNIKKPTQKYIFGQKGKSFSIPAKKSLW